MLLEALNQLNARMSRQESQIQALTTENQSLTTRLASSASTSPQRPPDPRASLVDTRLLGKPENFSGDPQKYPGWSFKLKAYLGAIDVRYQALMAHVEQSSGPLLNVGLSPEEAQLSTQLYYVLVMLSSGAALDKCHNAGVNEGFETWRNFVMEYEPRLRTRTVGLLMQVLSYKFSGSVATKLDGFERLVRDYESQSGESVTDATRIGVMLGMEEPQIREHLIRNAVRLNTWAVMKEEILEVTRTQRYMNNQPVPMQLGALPDLELGALPKGKKGKKGKADGKGKAKNKKGDMGKAAGGDKEKTCYYCQKVGHPKAECRKRIADLAKAEGKPVGAMLQEESDYLLALPLDEGPADHRGRRIGFDRSRSRRRRRRSFLDGSHRQSRRPYRPPCGECAQPRQRCDGYRRRPPHSRRGRSRRCGRR